MVGVFPAPFGLVSFPPAHGDAYGEALWVVGTFAGALLVARLGGKRGTNGRAPVEPSLLSGVPTLALASAGAAWGG